jgi:hypothetical protein
MTCNFYAGRIKFGHMVHQINTTGDTAVLSRSMIHNHSGSVKRAATYFAPNGARHLDQPASATALAGLAPNSSLGNGFASGYDRH